MCIRTYIFTSVLVARARSKGMQAMESASAERILAQQTRARTEYSITCMLYNAYIYIYIHIYISTHTIIIINIIIIISRPYTSIAQFSRGKLFANSASGCALLQTVCCNSISIGRASGCALLQTVCNRNRDTHLGANYCTPEINTSEFIVDFQWHFPMDFQWHFPTKFQLSVVVSKGLSLVQWRFAGISQ